MIAPHMWLVTPRTHPNLAYLLDSVLKEDWTVELFVSTVTADFDYSHPNLEIFSIRDLAERLKAQNCQEAPSVVVSRFYPKELSGLHSFTLRNRIPWLQYDQRPYPVNFIDKATEICLAIQRRILRRPRTRLTPSSRKWIDPEAEFNSRLRVKYFNHPSPFFPTAQVHPRRRVSTSVKTVGTVAKSGEPRKRIDILLRALMDLQFKGRLVIIGTSLVSQVASPNAVARYQRKIEKYCQRAEFEVLFEQDLTRSESINRLKSLDLFCLPSRKEPFSISVLEAKALGLPVIINRDNGAHAQVANGRDGYVIGKSLRALKAALKIALDRPDLTIGNRAARSQAATDSNSFTEIIGAEVTRPKVGL